MIHDSDFHRKAIGHYNMTLNSVYFEPDNQGMSMYIFINDFYGNYCGFIHKKDSMELLS